MEQNPPILVLVTLQRACARLIRHGADMALRQHSPLHVLHVVVRNQGEQDDHTMDAQTLNYLYALSSEAGAQMTVLTADVALTAIAEYASQQSAKQVILGGGEHASGIAETLARLLPGVEVIITGEEE